MYGVQDRSEPLPAVSIFGKSDARQERRVWGPQRGRLIFPSRVVSMERGVAPKFFLDSFLFGRVCCPVESSRNPPESRLQSPMNEISDSFTDEDKEHLSYLGSMLRQEPSAEEQEAQDIIDAVEKHGMMIKGKLMCPFKKKN
jgi:hypothetical protein